jgi:hypothetical protein
VCSDGLGDRGSLPGPDGQSRAAVHASRADRGRIAAGEAGCHRPVLPLVGREPRVRTPPLRSLASSADLRSSAPDMSPYRGLADSTRGRAVCISGPTHRA